MIVLAPSLVLSEPYQFTLNHPLIGYDTVTDPEAFAATSEDPEALVVNLANPSTHLFWKPATAGDHAITITLDGEKEHDYVGIARHNLGSTQTPITILGATTVDTNGDPIFNELIAQNLVADDSPILYRFTKQSLIALQIDLDEGTDLQQIAVVYVGELLTLQRKIYVSHTPIVFGRQVKIETGRSENGQYLGRVIVGETRETSVSLQNLTPDWYRDYLDPFIEASNSVPFFFAWRPQDYPDEIGFAWLTNNPQPSNQRPNGMMQIDLNMSGID